MFSEFCALPSPGNLQEHEPFTGMHVSNMMEPAVAVDMWSEYKWGISLAAGKQGWGGFYHGSTDRTQQWVTARVWSNPSYPHWEFSLLQTRWRGTYQMSQRSQWWIYSTPRFHLLWTCQPSAQCKINCTMTAEDFYHLSAFCLNLPWNSAEVKRLVLASLVPLDYKTCLLGWASMWYSFYLEPSSTLLHTAERGTAVMTTLPLTAHTNLWVVVITWRIWGREAVFVVGGERVNGKEEMRVMEGEGGRTNNAK